MRVVFPVVSLVIGTLLIMRVTQAVVISDRAGGTIYWGGKYVNIKPSGYTDAIGSRSRVDQMEVIMKDDVLTVRITGPYFFNYAHNLRRTRDAPPGDLYVSSQGWKVKGDPPYNEDTFEASEGWDYVVSFENKKVYKLAFSEITMTSALPYVSRYRAHQAWRGGYGEPLDDAGVVLTDRGLTFTFSVRNMVLSSEIGLHWTMKCGNDIIEGSASIPPIAMAPPALDMATVEPVRADPVEPLEPEALLPASLPIGAPAAPLEGTLAGTSPPVSASSFGPAGIPVFGTFPLLALGSGSGSSIFAIPGGNSTGSPGSTPLSSGPTPPSGPATSVPEPSSGLLLLAGLCAFLAGRRLTA